MRDRNKRHRAPSAVNGHLQRARRNGPNHRSDSRVIRLNLTRKQARSHCAGRCPTDQPSWRDDSAQKHVHVRARIPPICPLESLESGLGRSRRRVLTNSVDERFVRLHDAPFFVLAKWCHKFLRVGNLTLKPFVRRVNRRTTSASHKSGSNVASYPKDSIALSAMNRIGVLRTTDVVPPVRRPRAGVGSTWYDRSASASGSFPLRSLGARFGADYTGRAPLSIPHLGQSCKSRSSPTCYAPAGHAHEIQPPRILERRS